MSELGSCCGCKCTGTQVRNIMMLDRQGPEGFMGWACLVCGLPPRGAIAVLCDDCMHKNNIVYCCAGVYAQDDIRIALADLPLVEFEHDMQLHDEDDADFWPTDDDVSEG